MKSITILCILFLLAGTSYSQQPGQDKRQLHIVDTLSAQEKTNRYPVITQAEVDSLAGIYNASHPVEKPAPVKEIVPEVPVGWIAGLIAAIILVLLLVYSIYAQQNRAAKSMDELHRQVGALETALFTSITGAPATDRSVKSRNNLKVAESSSRSSDVEKLKKELQSQEVLLSEYRFVKQEYEAIKQQITDVFKVRNYPGYDKSKSEQEVLESLLQTEKTVAAYAYDHFLRPIIAITDANKNSPSKISKPDRDKVMDLLLSLSLFYGEYLYLRVNELSIGGHIAERIGSLKNGATLNPELLRKLNIEHGSRALVMRMVLDKQDIKKLSYPVFDETDLNLS